MRGLPGSGKSTYCKELMSKNGNYVRCNRDLLREMLHFNKWTGKNEGVTVKAETYIAEELLESGINVIIDDCNLNGGNKIMWKTIAECRGAKFEVVDMTDESAHECVKRDIERGLKVGNNVIMNMALQYELYKPKKGFIICDLDGTICDITHRLKFVNGEGKKDWNKFFAGIPEDNMRVDTYKMLCSYQDEGYDIVFVSARPQDHEGPTMDWLERHMGALQWETLIMRRAGDRRPDTEVKKQILDTYFKDKSLIYRVIDDRPSVIRMWRENGLDVIDVGSGREF